jgi:hypothetical protein
MKISEINMSPPLGEDEEVLLHEDEEDLLYEE